MSELAKVPAAVEVAEAVAPMLHRARQIYGQILRRENALRLGRDRLLILAFRLGEELVAIKEEIGHGRWLFWLGGNWPELGERNARRCIALFLGNDPKSVESSDLTVDSVRKFMWDYVPEKEKKELAGDEKLPPVVHQLTFVNNFAKWDQRITAGLETRPPDDVLMRDIGPVIKRLVELLGREKVASLL